MNRLAYIPSSRRCSGLRNRRSHRINDSVSLSNDPDYREILRLQKHRAICLGIAIVSLLIAAACAYFAQS